MLRSASRCTVGIQVTRPGDFGSHVPRDMATQRGVRLIATAEDVVTYSPVMVHRAEVQGVPTLRATLEELLAIWDNRPAEVTSVGRGRRVKPARLAVVLGLAAHTHRLARAALLLGDAGNELAAMPLVRGALEHGLTAQWICQYEDEAVAGFANEHERQRRNFAKTLLESGLRNAEEVAELLDKPPTTERSSADAAAARR